MGNPDAEGRSAFREKRLRRFRSGQAAFDVKRRIVSGGGDTIFAVVLRTSATLSDRSVIHPAA